MNTFRYELKTLEIEYRNALSGKIKLRCPPHLHREIELLCMYGGSTVAYADSTRYEIYPGDIFISFPDQIHYFETHGTEKYHLMIIKPDILPELLDTLTMGVPETSVIRGALNIPEIAALVDGLSGACSKRDHENPYVKAQRRGYLLALFSELLPRMRITQPAVGDSDALRAIVAFCAQNFAENLSLSLLEEKLHLNKYYISHLFSEKLDIRFNDYINSLRVTEAKRYLRNTDLSVTEISEIVGFNTLRTFNRAFMKQIGISPSEYRKKEFLPQKQQGNVATVGES